MQGTLDCFKENCGLPTWYKLAVENLTNRQWREVDVNDDTRNSIDAALSMLADNHLTASRKRIGRKLASLYGGPVEVPKPVDQFLNLSSITLTEMQRKFLNLGLNCHYISRPSPLAKRIELEMLIDDIQRLEREKKVTTHPDLQAEFIREANTSRGHTRSSLLTPELRAAAKELKDNNNIVIRRADKSPIFVLLDKEDYLSKMSLILDDTTKFKKITRNPTDGLKVKLNRLIPTNNALAGAPKLPLIEGDHKLGYIYGNVKTHKPNQPLRPIISQIPAVTYKLAKRLHALISPFTPSSFSLKSTEEFLDIIKTSRPSGIIASMDVESLFTHVPINETINFICNRLYRSDEIHFPIPEDILRQLLQACTKEVPFYGPDKNMYVQIDGVAMGSPLGVLFANFYMGSIEETIFTQHHELKPSIYTRYVDDIFISADTENSVSHIIEMFKKNSSLNYTHEIEIERKLPFLDTVVLRGTDSFSTEVCYQMAEDSPWPSQRYHEILRRNTMYSG
ncbi:uncharacterized protein LOC143018709 [Oratosquilla oratoria]|uniref:uncharacterized protein LOC143018709 n=1 Tax=Oratosquilla oratoria TaxID=337810 RepID=UPI003F76529B